MYDMWVFSPPANSTLPSQTTSVGANHDCVPCPCRPCHTGTGGEVHRPLPVIRASETTALPSWKYTPSLSAASVSGMTVLSFSHRACPVAASNALITRSPLDQRFERMPAQISAILGE